MNSKREDEAEDECDHDDYESDINGRATCNYCSYSWWQTKQEIEAEHMRYTNYDAHMRREERRERFRTIREWFRRLISSPRKPSELDDEIPF